MSSEGTATASAYLARSHDAATGSCRLSGAGPDRISIQRRTASAVMSTVSTSIVVANAHRSLSMNTLSGAAAGMSVTHQPGTLITPAVSTVTSTNTNGMPVHNA